MGNFFCLTLFYGTVSLAGHTTGDRKVQIGIRTAGRHTIRRSQSGVGHEYDELDGLKKYATKFAHEPHRYPTRQNHQGYHVREE